MSNWTFKSNNCIQVTLCLALAQRTSSTSCTAAQVYITLMTIDSAAINIEVLYGLQYTHAVPNGPTIQNLL